MHFRYHAVREFTIRRRNRGAGRWGSLGIMTESKSAGPECPICHLPVGESKHICHLCKANGREVRFDSGPCEAEHLSKAHTLDEVERFEAAKTINKQ
jgi:hypothetical protein